MTGISVTMDRVTFRYEDMEMLFDIRFEAGGLYAVMGPSGAGKTTLLNLVAGFETPRSGRILFDGRDMTRTGPDRRPVSMIFQENNLFAHLTVRTNIALGLRPDGRTTTEDDRRIREAQERTGLAGMEGRLPGELSGGQRQRVALARALLRDRPVMLLDEPFAALGPALRRDMLEFVAEIHRERGFTIVMVTHLPEDALAIAERVVFMDEGRILACTRPGEMPALARNLPQLASYLGPSSTDSGHAHDALPRIRK